MQTFWIMRIDLVWLKINFQTDGMGFNHISVSEIKKSYV
jgi:hypothetical protein